MSNNAKRWLAVILVFLCMQGVAQVLLAMQAHNQLQEAKP